MDLRAHGVKATGSGERNSDATDCERWPELEKGKGALERPSVIEKWRERERIERKRERDERREMGGEG